MGTSPATHLWTVRLGNDVATTLSLEVFTQRNFKFELYWQKQQIRVLCHPLGDLGVTYTFHLWLTGKRVVDFLLMLIERNYCVRKGRGALSTNFMGNEGFAHQQLLASEAFDNAYEVSLP